MGIDPGRIGAIAVLHEDSDGSRGFIHTEELPYDGRLVSVPSIVDTINMLEPNMICIEEQAGRPKDGTSAINTIMRAYGQMVGMCQALQLPLHIVKPALWKKKILYGYATDVKDGACEYVATKWPEVNLRPGRKIKAHDGIADACCISEYGMILWNRQV